MTDDDAREIAHAFRLGLNGLLADSEIERFLEALPDPADRVERLFRLAEASRVDLVGDLQSGASSLDRNTLLAMIDELKRAVTEFFAGVEDMDDIADRLAETRPPDLTLEDGFVMAAWMKEAQRDAYRLPIATIAANLRRFLEAPSPQ
ncbi:MAG: hypothetical protein ACREM1_15540 [Longimicrobiales bacterium]